MADLPKLGEVKSGRKVGFKSGQSVIWTACEKCGKERWVEFVKGFPVSHRCRNCAGRDNLRLRKNWQCGKIKDQYGYIHIKLHPDDFFRSMARHDRYVLEHRLVMAKSLGRCLQPFEIVHHKNGVKDDNRPSNLTLNTQSDHLREHYRGYKDGYRQGYQDAQNNKIEELLKHIKLLEWKLKEKEGVL